MTDGGAHDRLLGALRSRAGHPAVVWNGRSFTFEEIGRLSSHYAAQARRRSASAAATASRSSRRPAPSCIAAFVGHLTAGIIHVPINTRYKADEARHILEDSGAVAVLVGSEEEECTEVLREILRMEEAPGLHHVLKVADAFPSTPPSPSSPSKQIFSFSSSPPPKDTDVAMLIYTSGTTGKSKGVALSYRALADNTASVTGLWRFAPEDRLVLALPLFHVHGLVLGVAGMLVNGLTLLLEPRFDAARVVRAFAEEGATVFMGVPTMYVRLLEHLEAHPGRGRAPSGRPGSSRPAALPCPQRTSRRFARRRATRSSSATG